MKTTLHIACGLAGLLVLVPLQLPADERDDRIRALEKRVEQLEKILQARQAGEARPAVATVPPQATEGSKSLPAVSLGASGFTLRSADGNFRLRFRGVLQLDSRSYVDDGGISDNDTFALRRARPILEGTVFRDFDFLFTPEFGGSSVSIRDAWLNYRYSPDLQLRAGKMRTPGGLERWQSGANGFFIERSLISNLPAHRDLGFMFHGEIFPGDEDETARLGWSGVFNYAVGVFNGVGDGGTASNSDFDDGKAVAARAFVHPFLKTECKPLRGLGIGVAGNYGDLEGSDGLPDDGGYDTEARQAFFRYLDGVIADGEQWRILPQAYYHYGPFGFMAEYGISSQRIRQTAGPTLASATAHNAAWQVAASYVLTGEDASFMGVTPQKNFDPRNGGWGAWEIAARYSQLNVDDDVFPIFANPAASAERADAWTVGLNWYLNRIVRASFNFNHTDFKGGQNGDVTRQDENAFLTRLQLRF